MLLLIYKIKLLAVLNEYYNTQIQHFRVGLCYISKSLQLSTHSPGGERVGGQYFGRRQTLDWPLTV